MSDSKAKAVTAVVAPGRSVHDGKVVRGPGSILEMAAHEVERLRAGGFLLPSDGVPEARVNGPSVNNEPNGVVKPK